MGAKAVARVVCPPQHIPRAHFLPQADERLLQVGVGGEIAFGVVHDDVDAVVVVAGVGMHAADFARGHGEDAAARGGHDVQPLVAGQAKLGVVPRIGPEILVNAAILRRPCLKAKCTHGNRPFSVIAQKQLSDLQTGSICEIEPVSVRLIPKGYLVLKCSPQYKTGVVGAQPFPNRLPDKCVVC